MSDLSISVKIAERIYKLTIEKQEEEIVRKAALLINDKIREFAGNYMFKDKQDLLAMIALQYTSSALNYEQLESFKNTKLRDKLLGIDKKLEMHLEK
ncbi:MAG: cell division protein ZapA [Bacteroidales bacterium]|jgi:cell division protein ZapA|nr:cell division protein ZapA [Bacteroidales bacterium]MDD4215432.1 cell division protein ZapA [Bacteroidales bacterium]